MVLPKTNSPSKPRVSGKAPLKSVLKAEVLKKPECPEGTFKRGSRTYVVDAGPQGFKEKLVPDKAPRPVWLPKKEMDRITHLSLDEPPNPEEVQSAARAAKMEGDRQSALRIHELRKNLPPDTEQDDRMDLAQADTRKTDHTKQRAHELIMENKNEVKFLNSLIMSCQCQNIRKQQIKQKEQYEQEMKNIEREMILQQQHEIEKEARKYASEKAEELRKHQFHIKSLAAQIEEREYKKKVEEELLLLEGMRYREGAIAEMQDKANAIDQKRKEQAEMMAYVNDWNRKVVTYIKNLNEEEDRMEDLKIKEYLDSKDAREKYFREIKEKKEEEKEAMMLIIREKQLKSMGDTEKREAFHQQYVADLVERKWRETEKDKARKAALIKIEMQTEVKKQQEDNLLAQARAIMREKEEHESITRVTEEREKERAEEEKRKMIFRDKYRVELLNQLNEKEKEAIEEHQKNFVARKAFTTAIELEKLEIKQYMDNKLEQFKKRYNVPEGFDAEVRRQMIRNKMI